jgi:uncharacterized protein (TIGR02996 family)
MDDELAFFRAAAAEPDDDTVRLVYADWLDERGDGASATQAAFARLQVRRSRLDVFDPGRAGLLEQESDCLRRHARDWNGRIHRRMHRAGLRDLVDARRGLIRNWGYHRGMVSRVRVAADGLAAHPELVFSLGPIQGLELAGWRGWSKDEERSLEPHFAGVKVFALRRTGLPLMALARFTPLRRALMFDLRHVPDARMHLTGLLHHVTLGELPPVVLFRGSVRATRPYTYAGRQYSQVTSRDEDHVIDPFGRWDELRPWLADFTGELLTPVRYQGTTR